MFIYGIKITADISGNILSLTLAIATHVYLCRMYIEIYVRSHTVGGKVEKFYNLYLYELGYGFGLK